MEDKLITIVVLPYSKAHILKMRLGAKDIECDLEDMQFIEGATSYTVRVKILEKDLKAAIPVLEDFLGKPVEIQEEVETKKSDRHVLVPIDFSVPSEKACKIAFDIAEHLEIKMVLMHSFYNPLIHSIPFSDVYAYDSSLLSKVEFAEQNANDKFKKFVTKMAESIGKEKWDAMAPEFIIQSGYADEDILAYSREHTPQLIVLGSSGEEPSENTLGSTAVDVMYNAPVPVLVIPEDTPELSLEDISTALYATNFDEKDFVALDKLMSILYPFNIKVVCTHVGQPKGDGWDLARLNGMKDILKEKYRNEEFDCKLIVGNNTLEALEKFIEEEDIHLLSLTTHKRNMLSRLFNPSLARKMIFHTHTPLLVFHA